MPLRRLAQLPERVLQALAQALEALGETHRPGLPVRVSQHEVINQVRKTLPLDGDTQLLHVREVRRAQTSRMVLLRKEHLAAWAVGRPPVFHLPLQRPQLAILKMTWVVPLQILEDGLGFKSRVGAQQFPNLDPDANKRIRPSAPTWHRLQLTRQPSKTPVLPRRLGIHPRLRRRYLLSPLCVFQRK